MNQIVILTASMWLAGDTPLGCYFGGGSFQNFDWAHWDCLEGWWFVVYSKRVELLD
jgi:hypothetical protein